MCTGHKATEQTRTSLDTKITTTICFKDSRSDYLKYVKHSPGICVFWEWVTRYRIRLKRAVRGTKLERQNNGTDPSL